MISNKASNSVTKIRESIINCQLFCFNFVHAQLSLTPPATPAMHDTIAYNVQLHDHDVHASLPRSVLCTVYCCIVRQHCAASYVGQHSLPTKATGTYIKPERSHDMLTQFANCIKFPGKVPDHLPDKELQSHDLKIPHSFSPAPRFTTNSSEHVACGFVYLHRPRSFTPGIHVHLASSARSRTFHLA